MSTDQQTLNQLRIDRSSAPKRNSLGWLIAILLVIGIAALAVWWWLNRPKSAVVRTVLVQESTTGGQRTLLNASGYVTARRAATVSSKVTGKVAEVLIEEGMKVDAGQVLARLDASNAEASLKLAQAQLESSRKALNETMASLEQAERELRRVTKLATEKIATQADLDRADADVKVLKARLESQEASVAVADRQAATLQLQLDDTVIRAPFAGVVTAKNAQPGEMISPMSAGGSFTRTGIGTIVDMSSLEIEVDVNESYINRVVPEQRVEATLDSYPDWRIPSKVIAIIPTADRQKATVKVRVGFEKLDPRILPDMGVKVAFQGKEASQPGVRAITVPKSAVRQRDGKEIVWVVTNNRVERRAVTLGGTVGDQTTIAAGLNGGERIVIEGPENLADNAAVTEAKK
jgi:RND family efflux transporter MFP subunit